MGLKLRITIEIPDGEAHIRGFAKCALYNLLRDLRGRSAPVIEGGAFGHIASAYDATGPICGSWIVEKTE